MDNSRKLFEDVKIFPSALSPDAIQINSGVYVASAEKAPSYMPNAIIPKDDWRGLTQDEMETLKSQDHKSTSERLIGILDLPDGAFSLLEEAGFYDLSTEHEILEFPKKNDIKKLYKPFLHFFIQHLEKGEDLALTPFLTKPPNQLTVTVNEKEESRKKIGIHLDTWDKLPMQDLPKARNRICINGGLEERYFLFFNLTVKTIAELLKSQGVDNSAELLAQHCLLHTFIKHFPNYPMIRLKVKPKQAYLAPTENVFHDGSTLGTETVDRHMTCQGHFNIYEY